MSAIEKIKDLKDLLNEQLCELFNAENQQRIALLKMKEKATSRELKLIIYKHLDETALHIKRLKGIFRDIDIAGFGEDSEVMHSLVEEGNKLMSRSSDPEILDASIISALQYVEHYEIAGYGTACAYARELNLNNVAEQLYITLMDEKLMDERLSGLAIEVINKKANIHEIE